jgi:hypothetical protein
MKCAAFVFICVHLIDIAGKAADKWPVMSVN